MSSAQDILKEYWQFDAFRGLQEEIIEAVLTKKDCIALLPTGAGKSLCYQVPAMALEGVCLVVSPLISLMQDQVQQLQARKIPAAYLHGGMSYSEVDHILTQAAKGALKLLYLSPERLQSRQFEDALAAISVSLIAVDEAHCISQWGHDFRPEYRNINSIKEACPSSPIIALTASATQEVLADIQSQLGLSKASVFRSSFERSNIFYSIVYSESKAQYISQYFQKQQHCGIVYCRSRKQTEELAYTLQQNGLSAAAYHAGMPKEKRLEAQEHWMQDKVLVMVATSAFGMGIDKATVRSVVHFDPPEHLEAYYQETGRAGRDGRAAKAICLYRNADLEKLSNSTQLYFPGEAYLKKVYQNLCDFLQVPAGLSPDKYFDFDINRFISIFKLEPIAATHSLRLLAQEGLWTLSESLLRPSTVQFIADRAILDDVGQRYPMPGMVATALLRLYSGIFHYPCTINLFQISRHLKMKQEDVVQALQQLHRMQIIVFVPSKEGPQLYFHHYRVPSQNLLLNHKRINQLRSNHKRRTEYMIRFLSNTDQCSNQLLLAYFDEPADSSCEHCSICLSKKQRAEGPKAFQDLLFETLEAHEALGVQDLLGIVNHEPSTSITIIRQMIEEGQVSMDEAGILRICKPRR